MVAIVRQAIPDEADVITQIAMQSKAHWGYDKAFMMSCREELTYTSQQLEQEQFFILEIDRCQIVGFYQIFSVDSSTVELEALFVLPGFIGKGYGRILMRHALNQAYDLNYLNMTVQSDPNAALFYQKMGGRLTGEKESGSINGRFLPLFTFDIKEHFKLTHSD